MVTRFFAIVLLLLTVSPYTAPFRACDLGQSDASHDSVGQSRDDQGALAETNGTTHRMAAMLPAAAVMALPALPRRAPMFAAAAHRQPGPSLLSTVLRR
jgi:hypothetical protein